jgi:hypothetical protein
MHHFLAAFIITNTVNSYSHNLGETMNFVCQKKDKKQFNSTYRGKIHPPTCFHNSIVFSLVASQSPSSSDSLLKLARSLSQSRQVACLHMHTRGLDGSRQERRDGLKFLSACWTRRNMHHKEKAAITLVR